MSDGPGPTYIRLNGGQTLTDALTAAGVPRDRPVLIVAGYAKQGYGESTDRVGLLLRNVVAPICQDHGAVVITGGTNQGLMSLTGAALAEFAPNATLVGVAPHRRLQDVHDDDVETDSAAPEPHHQFLIGAPGRCWGDESTTVVGVAERIVTRNRTVMLAIGGNKGVHREVALAATRRWPVILVTGVGGQSEEIAKRLGLHATDSSSAPRPSDAEDEDADPLPEPDHVAEERDALIASAKPLLVSHAVGNWSAVGTALRWRLCDDALLKEGWTRYAAADATATRDKKPVRRLVGLALALGTLTVLLAVLRGRAIPDEVRWQWLRTVLLYTVTALPALVAFVLAIVERRSRSGGWINMRAAAETTLREIYRYRAGVNRSAATDALLTEADRRARLAASMHDIDKRVGGRSAMWLTVPEDGSPSTWPPKLPSRFPLDDQLLCPLDGQAYDAGRVECQLRYLTDTAHREGRASARLAATSVILGGAAAFGLAASWREWWGPTVASVASALAAALLAWREYVQRDAVVESYQATAASVRAARARWLAIPAEERLSSGEVARYVAEVEDALGAENSTWERSLDQAHRSFRNTRGGS